MMQRAGVLYVVATPIGNLQDMSARAIETLGRVSLVAAEDTRHSRKLLAHFGIATPLVALHEHNEREQTRTLLERLAGGFGSHGLVCSVVRRDRSASGRNPRAAPSQYHLHSCG